MKKHFKIVIMAVLLVALFLQPASAVTNNEALKIQSIANSIDSGESVPGELIVTIEGEKKPQSRTNNPGQTVRNHVKKP